MDEFVTYCVIGVCVVLFVGAAIWNRRPREFGELRPPLVPIMFASVVILFLALRHLASLVFETG